MLLNCFSRLRTRIVWHRLFSTARTADVQVDNLVIGAGIVGLAVAEKLTRERPTEATIVIDKNKRCGEETSSRNSEVIHAGIYYPKDSLKTRLCIQGNRLLYQLLSQASIPHRRLGKLVVAQTHEQHQYLLGLHRKSTELGVETEMLTADQAAALEPQVRAPAGALLSPSTGILDSHALMDYLEQKIVQNGGDIALATEAVRIERQNGSYWIDLADGSSVLAGRVFNAAGLHADKVAVPNDHYRLHFARGVYFAYTGQNLRIQHLIYPCPEKHLSGLGTHLTLDMAGKIKFGPDLEYIDSPADYSIPDHSAHKQRFVDAIHTYLPDVQPEKLHPDYAGIRPKLAGPGEPFKDFVIKEEKEKGLDNFFNLIGIESPGLTSCLAIANYVHDLIRD